MRKAPLYAVAAQGSKDLFVIVKAFARLAAQVACIDILAKKRARTIFGIAEPFIQYFHNMENNIIADKIGKSQRSHRMIEAELADRINIFLGRNAFHQSLNGFVDHGDNNTVAYETGEIINLNGALAEFLRRFEYFFERFVRCCDPVDDLNQFHDRRRVEEMHADNFVRTVGSGGNLRNGQGRRI